MIVVAVMSVGSAFIFVTKFHSSKDVYDTTMAPASGSSGDGAEDGNGLDTEKDGKAEKVKSKDKKKKKKKDKKKDKKEGTEGNKEENNSVLDKILVPLDSIVVNIGKVDSKRYLRVIISLEVKNSEIKGTIKKNKVVFRDKLVSFLSSKNLTELSDRANHQKLRREIRNLLNSKVLESDNAISQVYFSDFIIQ